MNVGVAALPRRTGMRALARSTGIVAAIRGLDFGLSFLVSVLFASRFGAGAQLDAFFLARRTTVGFADTIRKLVGQIVLPPTVAAIDRGEAPTLAVLPKRTGWFLLAFAGLMLAGTLVPSALVSAFAPGFDGARHDLAATMMRIMTPLLGIAVAASLLAAVLQARRRYWLSEGTNLVQRLVLVLVLAFLIPPLGIVAGAWTMLGSGVAGLAILAVGAWPLIRPRGGRAAAAPAPAAPQVGGGLLAAVVMSGYHQASTLLDFGFASTAGDGGVAALEYGARLVSLVPGLVMASLYTVLQPELIRAMRDPDRGAGARALARFQRIGVLAQAPVSVGMMLGAELIVRILFGYGAFGEASVLSAAATTAGYAAAGVFLAPFSATTGAIYADPHRPCLRDLALIAGIATLVRAGALAIATPTWGAAGIAWAAAASTAVALGVAQWVAIRRFPDLDIAAQGRDFARIMLCALASAVAGWALLAEVGMSGDLVGRALLLGALGAAVLAVFVLAALALRVPELGEAARLLRRRK